MSEEPETTRCVFVTIEGRVQGVGFRMWFERAATQLGLSGWVRNCLDGKIEAIFHGASEAVDEMERLCSEGPRGAEVTRLYVDDFDEKSIDALEPGFHIEPTRRR